MVNRELLEQLRERFDAKREEKEREAREREASAEEKNPELKKLGAAIRAIGGKILGEAMRGGEDLPQRLEAIHEEHRAMRNAYADLLETMGLTRDWNHPKWDCELCRDSGSVNGKLCQCFRKELVKESYRHSGFGKLLESQTFANFDLKWYPDTVLEGKRYSARDVMKEILNDCKAYAEGFGEGSESLLLIGGTGLGKTHLSSAIAGVVLGKGFDVVYESAPGVVSVFEKERFQNEENSSGTQRLFDADLLVLDDLGTEPGGKANVSGLYHLINYRASVAKKPTIISTNLTYRQLEKQYDTAILSRLLGEFRVKLFQGEDIRMAKLK